MKPDPFQTTIILHAPPDGATEACGVFNVTRSRIIEPVVVPGSPLVPGSVKRPDRPSPWATQHPNVISLLQAHETTSGDRSLTRIVRSQGEPPELVRVVYRVGDQLLAQMPATGQCLDTIDVVGPPVPIPGTGALFGPAEYAAVLRATVEAESDRDRYRARAFFADLDRRTQPQLAWLFMDRNSVQLMQQWLGGALTLTSGRFERRLKEERSKSGEYKVVQLAWNDARPLHYFSMLFHDLLLTYFPGRRRNGSTRLDRDAMEHAFESFAAGDLRVKLPVCDCHAVQPSSGLYVLFAELALLSAECGFDPLGAAGFWKQVANVLVRTQEIYCRRYMPTTSPKSNWDQTSYRACNFNACELPEHALRARIEDLRHSFRNADVRCLSIAAAQNADKYMPAQGR